MEHAEIVKELTEKLNTVIHEYSGKVLLVDVIGAIEVIKHELIVYHSQLKDTNDQEST